MFQSVSYCENTDKMLKQLPKGAFMTVKADDSLNTMVIGWGHIGFLWGKEVFVVYVRCSRYTYDLVEKSKEFTISVPLENDLKKELYFCGTESGRDFDKFATCNLTPINGRILNTPIIKECDLHFECKIIYQTKLDKNQISQEVKNRYYTEDDYHMVYYGEIMDSYLYK